MKEEMKLPGMTHMKVHYLKGPCMKHFSFRFHILAILAISGRAL